MIFNSILLITLLFSVFFPSPILTVDSSYNQNIENSPQEAEVEAEPYRVDVDYSNYEKNKEIEGPDISNFALDLDYDGKNETVVVKSYPGIPGDQNTEVYIDSSSQPVITEIGSFYAIKTHKMDNSNRSITELQLQTGQSINALFYMYKKGKLERVPVSTEKPPSWHGIISRNLPEFKDVDGDGTLELLAYYNFFNEPTRTVEVYTFTGSVLQKINEYEEPNPAAT